MNISSLSPVTATSRRLCRSSGSVSWGGLLSFVSGLIELGWVPPRGPDLILNVWLPDIVDFISTPRGSWAKSPMPTFSVGITMTYGSGSQGRDWETYFPGYLRPCYTMNGTATSPNGRQTS
jgi:ribonucleoside-diphosphate reductase alpha chain